MATVINVKCDNMTGTPTCDRPVTMIDRKGYVYCRECGMDRRQYQACRQLRSWELRRLEKGEPLARY